MKKVLNALNVQYATSVGIPVEFKFTVGNSTYHEEIVSAAWGGKESKAYYATYLIYCQWLLLSICTMYFVWQNNTYYSYTDIWGSWFCSKIVVFLFIKIKNVSDNITARSLTKQSNKKTQKLGVDTPSLFYSLCWHITAKVMCLFKEAWRQKHREVD